MTQNLGMVYYRTNSRKLVWFGKIWLVSPKYHLWGIFPTQFLPTERQKSIKTKTALCFEFGLELWFLMIFLSEDWRIWILDELSGWKSAKSKKKILLFSLTPILTPAGSQRAPLLSTPLFQLGKRKITAQLGFPTVVRNCNCKTGKQRTIDSLFVKEV